MMAALMPPEPLPPPALSRYEASEPYQKLKCEQQDEPEVRLIAFVEANPKTKLDPGFLPVNAKKLHLCKFDHIHDLSGDFEPPNAQNIVQVRRCVLPKSCSNWNPESLDLEIVSDVCDDLFKKEKAKPNISNFVYVNKKFFGYEEKKVTRIVVEVLYFTSTGLRILMTLFMVPRGLRSKVKKRLALSDDSLLWRFCKWKSPGVQPSKRKRENVAKALDPFCPELKKFRREDQNDLPDKKINIGGLVPQWQQPSSSSADDFSKPSNVFEESGLQWLASPLFSSENWLDDPVMSDAYASADTFEGGFSRFDGPIGASDGETDMSGLSFSGNDC